VYRFVSVNVTRRAEAPVDSARPAPAALDRPADTAATLWGYRVGDTLHLVRDACEIPATAAIRRSFATVGELVFAARECPLVATLSRTRIQGASFRLHDARTEFRRLREPCAGSD
jgi:hypothetical protein